MTDAEEAALAEVVAACRAMLDAQAALTDAVAARTVAVRRVRDAGVPVRRMSAVIRARLYAAGFTPGEVDAAGIGYTNLRRLL